MTDMENVGRRLVRQGCNSCLELLPGNPLELHIRPENALIEKTVFAELRLIELNQQYTVIQQIQLVKIDQDIFAKSVQ